MNERTELHPESSEKRPDQRAKARLSLEELARAQGGYTATQERPEDPPPPQPANP